MTEPTTNAEASGEAQLAALEQAIQAEAGQSNEPVVEDAPQESEQAPEYGQAFQELASKKGFKSVDDLVLAYESLESRSTRAEQSRSATERRVAELETQLGSIQKAQESASLEPEQRDALRLLEDTIQRTIDAQLAPIKQQMGAQKVQSQIEAVKSAFPWADNNDIDATLDNMVQNKSLTMDQAFKLATFEKVQRLNQVKAQAQTQQVQKNRAFVEGASQSKSNSNADYSKMTLDQLEASLPKADNVYTSWRGTTRHS